MDRINHLNQFFLEGKNFSVGGSKSQIDSLKCVVPFNKGENVEEGKLREGRQKKGVHCRGGLRLASGAGAGTPRTLPLWHHCYHAHYRANHQYTAI